MVASGHPSSLSNRLDLINVGPMERAISVLLGALLLVDSRNRAGMTRAAAAVVGGFLLERGLTGRCPVFKALDVSSAGTGDPEELPVRSLVLVRKSLTVARPADELYAMWRRLENLPTFMEHLESVEELDERRSRWVVRGPLGRRVEWEAVITDAEEGRRLAWRSVEGSALANTGSVTFQPAPGGRGTEVHVTLEYAPPAGSVGNLIARLFGESPERQIEDELRRFKQLAEAGETATAGSSSGWVPPE